jgi:hypothetical protein
MADPEYTTAAEMAGTMNAKTRGAYRVNNDWIHEVLCGALTANLLTTVGGNERMRFFF